MEGIGDYSVFLQQARDAVTELRELESDRDRTSAKLRQDKKLLESEKKAADDEARRTTKRRLDSVTAGYDKQISRAQEQLRKAKSRREAAKGKGVRERISDETADLRDENRRLRFQIRTLFQEHYVPGFCNTRLYYAIYLPGRPMDFLLLILTLLICFLVIPCGIYLLIPNRKWFELILLLLASIIIFGSVYMLLKIRTKDDNIETLKEGRGLRGQIRANQKNIRAVTRAIKRDLNEDVYNLGQYDDEIAQIQQELSMLTGKKKEAVNTFETVTKNIIFDEVMNTHKAKLDEYAEAVQNGEQELKTLEASIKEKELRLTDEYAPYVGDEFLTPERLDALAEILKSGSAANLTEAIQVYEKPRS